MGILRPAPEVDQPTYEIAGPVERFDMRDETDARMTLISGTPEYEEYYARRPQYKEWDDNLKQLRIRVRESNWGKDPINEQFVPSLFVTNGLFGSASTVEGIYRDIARTGRQRNVPTDGSEKKFKIDPEEMARKIKEYGMYLGAATVRITKLKQEWVYTHYSNKIGPGSHGKPVELDYENIICMPVLQDRKMKNIGRGASQETEDGRIYSQGSWISVVVAEFIRCVGYQARALPSLNAPYFVVPTFVDAGIGEQGRNSFVVSKRFGCNWRPAAVATNMPLALDKPVDFGLQDFCEKCKRCAEYCPSGAITKGGKEIIRGVRRWAFDGEKCRRYWEQLGHSCGICQAVCPWNHPNSWLHNGVRELSQRFPSLRSSIISAEQLVYGGYKTSPAPDWMTTPGGYFEDR